MKTRLLLPLLSIITLAGLPARAQSTNTPPPAPSKARLDQELAKLSRMSPEEKTQYLQSHPRLQQFVSTHPGAASANHDPAHSRVNEVNRREANLEKRIDQGVAKGTLTADQAANLEKSLEQIKQDESKDLQNDAKLSRSEAKQLNHAENELSHQIKQAKHPGKTK